MRAQGNKGKGDQDSSGGVTTAVRDAGLGRLCVLLADLAQAVVSVEATCQLLADVGLCPGLPSPAACRVWIDLACRAPAPDQASQPGLQ